MSNTCHHCQQHLVAYINNEASPKVRKRVATHLQTCETCYAAYIRERDTAQQITQELTLFAQADKTQLNNIWASVQAELDTPTPKRYTFSKEWQRGLVLVALAVICVLPWSLSVGNFTSPTLQNRMRPVDEPNLTPQAFSSPVHIVALDTTSKPTEDVLPPTPTSTPAIAPIPGE